MQKTKSASKKLAHSGTKLASKQPREKLQPKSVKPAKKTVSASAHAAKKDAGGKKKAAASSAPKKASAAAAPAKKPAVVQVIKKASTVKPAAAKAAKETAKDTKHAKDHGKDHGKDHAKDAKKKAAEPAHAPKAAKAVEKEAADKGKIVKKAGESHVTRKAPEKKAKAEVEHDDSDLHDDAGDDLAGEELLDDDVDAADEVAAEPEMLQAKAPKESKARKGSDEETSRPNEPADDEIVLTDAEGRRYCRVKECDQIATVDGGYCRYHYLLFWRNIQNRKKILSEGKLARYIEELTARYPDKYLELLRKDLRSEKDFMAAIQELEIDESGVDAEFEDEAQNYLDEVRGMGSETSNEREEDF